MIYQPPAGARDLLPLDVAQKCWIEHHLQQVFHRWSYHRIITPTLERLDTLMAGGAIQPETVIQLRDTEDGVLGLRPELTASIARAAVTRMAGATYPQRLYYSANVFRRRQDGFSGQHEFYQTGVELLGGSGLLADAEIILLLADCLNCLGLKHWHLILGEAELTRSLLAVFPVPLREQVRHCIAQLDQVALEALPLSPELRERALSLLNLRGKPADVLQQVATLDLAPAQRSALNNLKSLVELLGPVPLTLDLSLIQTFDYYTGLVFEVVSAADTGARVLGQGGRYDQLLGLYHPQGQSIPGIGFCLNLEDLHQVLLPTQLPQQTPASDWLVVPENAQALPATFAYAQHLRADPLLRVEIDLLPRTQVSVREYARRRRIAQIAWVSGQGSPLIESTDLTPSGGSLS